ncbi:MAG: radical SAM protein, partial [Bacteroidetes bacterium]|nr:radical SAM protein [Bacteroidota bacterium]
MNSTIIPSVNFHLWQPCNMRCGFCFATFHDVKKQILPKGHLPKEEAFQVVRLLGEFGFKKITFAGGEPTLCPWLPELIQVAKKYGMVTMIVTNGSKLNDTYLNRLHDHLDWIALSIDSFDPKINLASGRHLPGNRVFSIEHYLNLCRLIRKKGFSFKINTVVNRLNYKENLSDFIEKARPSRWKILQAI